MGRGAGAGTNSSGWWVGDGDGIWHTDQDKVLDGEGVKTCGVGRLELHDGHGTRDEDTGEQVRVEQGHG